MFKLVVASASAASHLRYIIYVVRSYSRIKPGECVADGRRKPRGYVHQWDTVVVRTWPEVSSGIAKVEGQRGQLPPGAADEGGGAKQPQQKYINNHKSEFDEIC